MILLWVHENRYHLWMINFGVVKLGHFIVWYSSSILALTFLFVWFLKVFESVTLWVISCFLFISIKIFYHIVSYKWYAQCLRGWIICISHASHSTRQLMGATGGARDIYYFSETPGLTLLSIILHIYLTVTEEVVAGVSINTHTLEGPNSICASC